MSLDHGSITPQLLRYKDDILEMARRQDVLESFKSNEIDMFPDMSPDAGAGNFYAFLRRVTIPAC